MARQMIDGIKRITNDGKKIRRAVRARTVGYVLAGLGLVAGLAWNEAIKAFIEEVVPVGRNTLFAKFLYAVAVTFVIVVASSYLTRFLGEAEEKK